MGATYVSYENPIPDRQKLFPGTSQCGACVAGNAPGLADQRADGGL